MGTGGGIYPPETARDLPGVGTLVFCCAQPTKKAGLSLTDPIWKDVRGQWGLPDSLRLFNELFPGTFPNLVERRPERERPDRMAVPGYGWSARHKTTREKKTGSRSCWRFFLHGKAIFVPSSMPRMHIGPTNSGKTFQALNELVNAASGWYLSPLRLLAYEVFDTLNKRVYPATY